jgi:hypothetical protein
VPYRSGYFPNRRGALLFYAEELPKRPAPAGPAGPAGDEAWLLCSPILEEKNGASAVFVTLGRALAGHGVRAFRIDYEAHGDSEGESASLSLDGCVDDVIDAATHLRRDGVRRLTLLGCRAGALIAARAAAAVSADRLVAWCPVHRGDEHIQEMLRLSLTTQLSVHKRVVQDRDELAAILASGGVVNVVGWDIGRSLYESLLGVTLADLLAPLTCRIDLLDLVRKSGDSPPDATMAFAQPPRVSVFGVPGMPFWIDGNFIDYQQAGLVQATTSLIGSTYQ